MFLEFRPLKRRVGRPSPTETGTHAVGLDLGPYPRSTPDPWQNRVKVSLFWHFSGGVIVAIATGQVQGGELPEHRCQQITTLNTYRAINPVMYCEGQRAISLKLVDTDWTYGIDILDDRVRKCVEVAVELVRLELRHRMLQWCARGITEEVVLEVPKEDGDE